MIAGAACVVVTDGTGVVTAGAACVVLTDGAGVVDTTGRNVFAVETNGMTVVAGACGVVTEIMKIGL